MRSRGALLLAVWALFACASRTTPTGQRTEANRFCTARCEEELGGDELYSCEALCECVVDALANQYPDKDVAAVLAMLDAGQPNPTPELDRIGRHCAPQSTLLPNSQLDLETAAEYSQYLKAAGEPPIRPTGQENAEVYRLLVYPSSASSVVVRVVRIERVGKLIAYTTTRLRAQEGEPLEIDWQEDGMVPNADWVDFKTRLIAGGFWSQVSQATINERREEECSKGSEVKCIITYHGTVFVLEGADASRYHVVDRWEPFEPPLESAVEWLLSISGNHGE